MFFGNLPPVERWKTVLYISANIFCIFGAMLWNMYFVYAGALCMMLLWSLPEY
jgi:hypothetical protein